MVAIKPSRIFMPLSVAESPGGDYRLMLPLEIAVVALDCKSPWLEQGSPCLMLRSACNKR
jgi:hypothetical protein